MKTYVDKFADVLISDGVKLFLLELIDRLVSNVSVEIEHVHQRRRVRRQERAHTQFG